MQHKAQAILGWIHEGTSVCTKDRSTKGCYFEFKTLECWGYNEIVNFEKIP
jgi:hypothetical protein